MISDSGLDEIALVLSQDEAVMCAADRRLEFREYSNGTVRVPVIRVHDATELSSQYRRWLGTEGLNGAVDIIGGGLAHFVSAVPDASMEDPETLDLVAKIVEESRRSGAHAVWPFATEMARTMIQTVTQVASISEAPSYYSLPTHGTVSHTELVALLPRARRKIWARDRRLIVAEQLHFEVSPLTVEGCVAASEAVAQTTQRNGGQSHRLLTEWQLRVGMARSGSHTLIRLQRRLETLGYAITSEFADVLSVHTFGVASGAEHRAHMYQLMFTASVHLATSKGVNEIWFGIEHGWPKFLRGCIEEQRWNVRFAPA